MLRWEGMILNDIEQESAKHIGVNFSFFCSLYFLLLVDLLAQLIEIGYSLLILFPFFLGDGEYFLRLFPTFHILEGTYFSIHDFLIRFETLLNVLLTPG